ncbi:hypothetical protein CNMCM8980_001791 [Aspergillus fumigatiaffinis]|uniref:Uncharacterized protein n=1 Tax=Aspergillus fumigatiaffinis TaxID=340414 RepID=A0A8H4GJA8_9EURO|nr:hypothetical protein CNMCM5878_001418 [Aspergillus fumigatiaffinis]KAF4223084.1 hypothetical protein CNMCM6457_000784 [Aspergillus fumigatiaffinis]KAF4231083.1 hypothetical protein CNMCM6805_000315 [Aspergillus fumigatiaffinis]KAF4239216.1 hypothetical protein CNMCM8980_001791 [Aspergillus fumigatiaffinis]
MPNCNTCEIMGCAGGKACATLKGLRYLIAALNIKGEKTTKSTTTTTTPNFNKALIPLHQRGMKNPRENQHPRRPGLANKYLSK